MAVLHSFVEFENELVHGMIATIDDVLDRSHLLIGLGDALLVEVGTEPAQQMQHVDVA